MHAILQAIHAHLRVTRTLFNDSVLVQEGLCSRAPGHDDHVHFELAWLHLSLGVGERLIYVGMLSPGRRREGEDDRL